MRALLSLDNSPVLADLVRSFKDNRTHKLLTSVAPSGIAAASSDISDTRIRLSTEAAFSLPPSNNLVNKNCLGFNVAQLFFDRFTTGVSCLLLLLPNKRSRKLQRLIVTGVFPIVSSLSILKASRSALCNLSARRHRPWPSRTLQTGQRVVFGLHATHRMWP